MVSHSETLASFLFNSVFPDDCRLCDLPLTRVSRIPVCATCLALPEPLQMDCFCQVCHVPFANAESLDDNEVCKACRAAEVNFDAAYCFGSYEGALQKLIQVFKYGKVESLSAPLSRLLVRAIPPNANFDVVMAMPMHWRKQWERGFNQAELLAIPVARRYGIALSHNLRRARRTKAQAGLNEKQRQENLRNSFTVRNPAQISGKRVLLIDDVLTTGATLRTAAAALKASGALRVTALTLARVDHRKFIAGSGQRRRGVPGSGFDSSSASLSAGGRKTHSAGSGAN